nr:hypothetical protein [Tanacetum cinerariifolium]
MQTGIVNRQLEELNDPRVTQEIKWLAGGPNNFVRRYSGYFVKGYCFHTKNHDNSLKSQNSGVVVTVLVSSNTQEVLSYYGSLKEVVKLNYSEELNDPRVTQEIKWLARGLNNFVRRYSGYFVKGYCFHTKNHENSLKSQNSGVVVTVLVSSNTQKVLSYYGSLKEVVKLNYSGKIRMVLFKCDWVDVNKGCKRDKFGITLVNFSHLTHSSSDIHDDPFVFASQVDKVFYAKDPQLEGWLVVRHVKVKDAFNMVCNSDQNSIYSIPDICDVPSLYKNEVDGDDEIDVTESMEDEEKEEEEEDRY